MKKAIKKTINFVIKKILDFLFLFNFGRYLIEKIQLTINLKKYSINYKNKKYEFFIPNRFNYFRAETFLTKEPETIDWIENFSKDKIFWDIGANIGLYSCFAAKESNSKVYAFEPSMFNLELLSKNIYHNDISDKITIVPISLTDKIKVSNFNMSNTEAGGSMSTFSKKYSDDGKFFHPVFNYKTLGATGNIMVNIFNLEKPHYIKIDVDGIEDLILNGCSEILGNVKSIMIEINENFAEKEKNVENFLKSRNFFLMKKKQFDIEKHPKFNSKINNQIWYKKQNI